MLSPTKVDDVRQVTVIAINQVIEQCVVVDEFPVRAGIDDRIRVAATVFWILIATLLWILIPATLLWWKSNCRNDHTVAALAFRAVFKLLTQELMNIRAFTTLRGIWTIIRCVVFVLVRALGLFGRFFWTCFIPWFQAQLECFSNSVVLALALLVTAGRRKVYRL